MSSTNFISGQTVIEADWLNDVNTATYNTIPAIQAPTGSSLIGYTEGQTGAVNRTVQAKLRETVSALDFGADNTGVADSTAAIQAAIDAMTAKNGGTIFFPCGTYKISSTLVITHSNIVLEGSGSDFNHDSGGTTVTAATILNWAGAAGGTMISISSNPTGTTGSRINGCGIYNMQLSGNSVAGTGVFIKSHNSGTFQNLFLTHFTYRAWWMTTFISGVNLGEAADNQANLLRNIFCRQTAAADGVAFWFDGSSNANTSYNEFQNLFNQQYNASSYVFANADTNVCTHLRAYRITGGAATTYIFDFWGPTAAGSVGGGTNTMINTNFTPSYGIILRGTESGFTTGSQGNIFIGNQAILPVAETGATVQVLQNKGAFTGFCAANWAVAHDINAAQVARDNMTTESLRVENGGSNAVVIANTVGTAQFGLNTSGVNFRITRQVGTGYVYVQAPLMVLPGSSVTPDVNGQLTFEATNNTTVTVKLKGSDGTVRSATLTLS